MMDYWCCKCDCKLEEVKDIKIRYGMMPLPDAPGYRCPGCGFEMIRKETILGDLAAAEKMVADLSDPA